MIRLINSRRFMTAFTGLISLLIIALVNKVDVQSSIAAIVLGICAANAGQGIFNKNKSE
jgi:hypothetical protein